MATAAERQVAWFGGACKKLSVRRISGAETLSSLRLHSITPSRSGCHVAVEKLSAQLNGFHRRSV